MKKFLLEFRSFAMRGNVIDMAVGVVIGSAFTAIVNSFVGDILSPLIGLIANVDLSANMFMIGDVAVKYGSFLTAVINFFLISFVIFLFVRALNKASSFGHREKETAPSVQICPFCKSEIPLDATRCPHCTSHLT